MINSYDIHAGKILIVDDQPANVMLLEQMLRNAGYLAVSSTTDSNAVCALHLEHSYDLILLDLHMPGMDGFQVMENLREIEAGSYLPVLVVTAQPSHKVRALKAGARDFVTKPFDLPEVLARVYNMLEVRLLHRESKMLYQRVLEEQAASQRMLLDALPAAIAESLKRRPKPVSDSQVEIIEESFAEVTVLVADVVGFTKFVEGAGAEVLVGVLDSISARFDRDPADRAAYRAAILDDAYLAVVGLPDAIADRTIQAANKAVDLIGALDRFNAHSRYKLRLRIGFEARSAVWGVGVGRSVYIDLNDEAEIGDEPG
jgi:adenylate cyclase